MSMNHVDLVATSKERSCAEALAKVTRRGWEWNTKVVV